ncbi:MAG: HIRAN domain-containing protein, partial [Tannerellaceae bacterium]|nr:HIRAN domain-containing protein [Tannerellaceae bacterium]
TLRYEREVDNEYDLFAVKTLFNQEVIGYIKRGHNEVFKDDIDHKIKIEVKEIRNTAEDKQLFVRVYLI